jgi:hypothetical protein
MPETASSGRQALVGKGSPAGHHLHTADLQYCNRHHHRGATELIIMNILVVPDSHIEILA